MSELNGGLYISNERVRRVHKVFADAPCRHCERYYEFENLGQWKCNYHPGGLILKLENGPVVVRWA